MQSSMHVSMTRSMSSAVTLYQSSANMLFGPGVKGSLPSWSTKNR